MQELPFPGVWWLHPYHPQPLDHKDFSQNVQSVMRRTNKNARKPARRSGRLVSVTRAMPILLLALWATPASAVGDVREGQAGQAGHGPGYAFQLYTVRADGEDFVRHEVRGRVRASPTDLFHAVRTVAADPDRAPRGQTRRVLMADEDEFVVHTRIDLPPLFDDRDIVTRGVRREQDDALRIDWSAVEHPEAPPSRGVVRIERSEGSWTFEPGDDGTTEVVYSSYVDLGGSLPSWLIDRMTASTVARTFEDVAREAIAPLRRVSAPGGAAALP